MYLAGVFIQSNIAIEMYSFSLYGQIFEYIFVDSNFTQYLLKIKIFKNWKAKYTTVTGHHISVCH